MNVRVRVVLFAGGMLAGSALGVAPASAADRLIAAEETSIRSLAAYGVNLVWE